MKYVLVRITDKQCTLWSSVLSSESESVLVKRIGDESEL